VSGATQVPTHLEDRATAAAARPLVTGLAAALLLCVLAAPARAQLSPLGLLDRFEDEDPEEGAERPVGWIFTPGTSMGLFWDSGIETGRNFFVESVFQRWVGAVNPFAEVSFRGRRTQFDAGYSGSIEKYWAADTNWEQRASIGLSRAFTRRFTASVDASHTAAPTTDRLQLVDAVIPYVEVGASWFNTGGALTYQLSPRTTVDLAYRFERVNIDRPPELDVFGTLRDGHSHTPSVRFMRAASERLSIGARAEYRREDINGMAQPFDVQSATGEFSYRVTPRTSITGGGGVSRVLIVDSTLSTTAPTYHGGFSHQLRFATFDARYERAFLPLFGFGTVGTTDSFVAAGEFPLGEERRYYLKGELAYARTRPVHDIGIGFDLDSVWTNASIGRQLTLWLRGEAFVSIASQSSNFTIFPGDANRHRVGVQVILSRPMRLQ
jgi:hypothetical protein